MLTPRSRAGVAEAPRRGSRILRVAGWARKGRAREGPPLPKAGPTLLAGIKLSVQGLLLLAAALAVPSAADDLPVPCYEPEDCVSRVELSTGLSLRVYRSHPLGGPNGDPAHAVISIHGLSRTADNYFAYAVAAAEGHASSTAMSPQCLNDTVVVAPRFLSFEDGPRKDEHRWSNQGQRRWSQGDDSSDGSQAISSFAAVDELYEAIRSSFPNVRTMTLAGHSAGGQFVNRYAAGGIAPRGASLQSTFVVMNPSSYLYIDDSRPFPFGGCREYNRYKYGLDDLNPYTAAVGRSALIDNLFERPQHYFIGGADTVCDDNPPVCDTRCSAMVQGPNRRVRAFRYHDDHIASYPEWLNNVDFTEVPGVPHSGPRMFEAASQVIVPPHGGVAGVGGYNLCRAQDRVVALDYDGGAGEDLFFYRPGYGSAALLRWNSITDAFEQDYLRTGVLLRARADEPEWHQRAGIAGYDLRELGDRAAALDHDGDGDDDLLLYRPGRGTVWLLTATGGAAFDSEHLTLDAFGGYDLLSEADRVLAWNPDGDGKDDLLAIRPGTGIAWRLTSRGDGTFQGVDLPGTGIAGYDLASPADRAVVLDYDGDGDDDLLLYRPGTGIAWLITAHTATSLQGVDLPGPGIAGYDLASPADRALSLDYDGDGDDDLLLYRPGTGVVWLLTSRGDGTFRGDDLPGAGIAGYDLASPADRAVALDHDHDGRDDLLLYRPGRGIVWLLRSNGDKTFAARQLNRPAPRPKPGPGRR